MKITLQILVGLLAVLVVFWRLALDPRDWPENEDSLPRDDDVIQWHLLDDTGGR